MENSHLFIFGETWPKTLYYSTGLKNRKKFNFDRNQLKLSMQHQYMYMFQEKI